MKASEIDAIGADVAIVRNELGVFERASRLNCLKMADHIDALLAERERVRDRLKEWYDNVDASLPEAADCVEETLAILEGDAP